MRARSEKGHRREAYRHHSFPSSRESGCRGMGRARWAIIRPRHSLGHTPNPLALCLFPWPTRLADGFGLKEITLLACGEIHPEKWVPRSPKWGFGPRTPTLLCCRDCGQRTFDPRVGGRKKIGELLAPPDPYPSLRIWRQAFQEGASLAAEGISLRDPPQEESTNREYLTLIAIFCQFLLVAQYHLLWAWPPAGLANVHAFSSRLT